MAAGRLRQLIEMTPGQQDASGRIVLDFGLVRGLAYYNGIIFEVSHPDWPGPLGGGGRYDGLARDLGGSHRLPALGFAYNLDALVYLTAQDSAPSGAASPGVLVVAASAASHAAALIVAQEIRNEGETVELEVVGRTTEEARAYAALRGLRRVIVVSEDGETTTLDV